jgi:amphi-Trp domain-containing protein
MSEKEKFEYTGRLDAEHMATYLTSLAEAIRRGSVRLSAGERSVTVTPEGIMRLEVSASNDPEKGRGSLELEVSWQRAAAEPAPLELEITAGAPVVAG